MLYYALMFLIVGLVAGALGLTGIAAIAGQTPWILFLIGVVLLIVHMARGSRPALRRFEAGLTPHAWSKRAPGFPAPAAHPVAEQKID